MWAVRLTQRTACRNRPNLLFKGNDWDKATITTTTTRHLSLSYNNNNNHNNNNNNSSPSNSQQLTSLISSTCCYRMCNKASSNSSNMLLLRRHYNSEAFSETKNNEDKNKSITPLSSSSFQSLSQFLRSPRQVAKLEESVLQSLSQQVQDPVFQNIITPQFRSVAFSSSKDDNNMIQVLVTLRSSIRLHPALPELSSRIEQVILKELSNTVNNNIMETAAKTTKPLLKEDGINNNNTETNNNSIQVQVQYDPSNTNKPMPWITANTVQEHNQYISKLGPGLRNVAHTVAVYSCKGGVGKSTIAVNLAYELAHIGVRVGLLDVDIYGPSLPVLVIPNDPAVRKSPLGTGMVKPIEHEGVKLMSLGFVSPDSGVPGSGPGSSAAIMRGPMAGKVTTQLLKGTDWGCLDILLLDLPPGTGDVQMTICQELELSGAVAVTTPSKLAITDARKGIDMFRSMGVSTLAAVENMSYFTCEGGGKHYPFGKGIGGDSSTFLKEEVGLKSSNIFQLPISEFTNTSNDEGSPLCCSRPADAASEIFVFSKLAKTVATELILLRNGKGDMEKQATVVTLVDESHKNRYDVASLQLVLNKEGKTFTVRLFSESGATQLSINGEDLRLRHPKTGEMLENEDISTDIENATCSSSSNQIIVQQHQHKQPKFIPMKVDKKGRYGYEIEFSDGATIIYSMLSIAIAAGGKVKEDNL